MTEPTVQSIRVSKEEITGFINRALTRAGVDKDVADLCAQGLVQTSLRGVDTHGIRLLPHYIRGVEGGRINKTPCYSFNKTSAATGTFDADHTLGYAAGVVAMEHAMDLARDAGAGFVSVRNSSHCGAMAYFAQKACKEDMIGLGFTHATPRMKSPGSSREFFGTNPLCFTAPMASEGPFCFDSAPTQIPFHKIIHAKKTNTPLPRGCAADEAGYETMDPVKAAQLLPIGIYKGFGWAMMVDILCALLSGMPAGRHISKMYGDMSEKRCLGQFFGAIRIDTFEVPEVFKERLQTLAEEVRSEPRLDENSENIIPGDPEKRCMAERSAQGIPLAEMDVDEMNRVAQKLGIQPLVLTRN